MADPVMRGPHNRPLEPHERGEGRPVEAAPRAAPGQPTQDIYIPSSQSGVARRRSAGTPPPTPQMDPFVMAGSLYDEPPTEEEMALLGGEVYDYQLIHPEASTEEALQAIADAGQGVGAVLAAYVLTNGGTFTYFDDVDGNGTDDEVSVTFTPAKYNGGVSKTEESINFDGDSDI